ncbi:MAG: hypothetical protein LBL70_06760 [Treponema sp.]|jgi:hypothetical protein|nr:hypothetical protein [Treponema sp.]
MEKVFDLYSILRAYSNKHNSAYIKIDEFTNFLAKYAARMAPGHPEWKPWAQETTIKFWNDMGKCTEDGRCVLLTDTADGRIFLPYFYVEKLKNIYRDIEKMADLPFPGNESLKFTLPEDYVEDLNLEVDLIPYFEKPVETFLPIIKLHFPDNWGSMLVLPALIPHRILEAAIFKVRYYLLERNNKDYITHKIYPHMQGRETFVRDSVDTIVNHPLDCIASLKTSGESTYLFWVCFCSQIKSDVGKKNEKLAADIAAIQAVFILEICNNLFKSYALKERERDSAFRALEANMDKPPYYYTIDSIIKFTNNKGMALLGQYSNKELESYIRKKTTESEDNEVPPWIIITARNDEKWFMKKNNLLPLVTRLLLDARPALLKEIDSRWRQMVQNYKNEPAMENNADFDRLLSSYIGTVSPVLKIFLDDSKLLWVYNETDRASDMIIPPASRIFHNGKLIPAGLLFGLRRREIITGVKLSLPFWYSLPILSSILGFFARLKKKKVSPRVSPRSMDIDFEEVISSQKSSSHAREIVNSARLMEADLVPQGEDLDEYLKEVESRWSKLLDKQARKNLVEDINALVRDHLRRSLRIRKHARLTEEDLKELAEGIIKGTPSLETLKANDYLSLYMRLYMIKLLLTIRL